MVATVTVLWRCKYAKRKEYAMQSQVVLYKRKEREKKPAGWVAQSAAGKKEFKSVCTFLCGPTVGACSTAAFVVSLLVPLFSRVHCEIEYASYV